MAACKVIKLGMSAEERSQYAYEDMEVMYNFCKESFDYGKGKLVVSYAGDEGYEGVIEICKYGRVCELYISYPDGRSESDKMILAQHNGRWRLTAEVLNVIIRIANEIMAMLKQQQ